MTLAALWNLLISGICGFFLQSGRYDVRPTHTAENDVLAVFPSTVKDEPPVKSISTLR
jgi:hypothetical protein